MQLLPVVHGHHLNAATLVAESSEFAVFDLGYDTFALVHRHAAVDWQAITISGDGVFRVLEILGHAARRLYRDVAADASRRPLLRAPAARSRDE